MLVKIWIGFVLWLSVVECQWVRNVDSSIIEEIQSNPSVSYMIQFYAPWCGHCKHLEPIYDEFARAVQDVENLQIVRLDATVYSDVANHYDIRGFPTIKFIQNSKVINYEGQRTKDALLKFIERAHGPSVRPIVSKEMFEQLRHDIPVFIVFVVDSHNISLLSEEYRSVIDRYYTQIEFFTVDDRTLFLPNDDQFQVFIVKNQHSFPYEPSEYEDKFETFVQVENVPIFPQISHSNIRDLLQTKKILVIYAYDDHKRHDKQLNTVTRKERQELIHQYVNENLGEFRKKFQFGWSIDLSLLGHIAMWDVVEPLFFLYDSQKHSYGMINTEESIENILMKSTEIMIYTGDSWSRRLIRPFWELYRTIMSMFVEAPLATMLVIGLPSAMLSIICYCICCLPNEGTIPEDQDEIEIESDDVKPDIDKKDD